MATAVRSTRTRNSARRFFDQAVSSVPRAIGLERIAILKTLESVGGSTKQAAALLGISPRTIQYRLRDWGLVEG